MKNWILRRWKPLAFTLIALGFYATAKINPELKLEQKLLETLKQIVEQTPE